MAPHKISSPIESAVTAAVPKLTAINKDERHERRDEERQWRMGATAFHAVMPHHASMSALWETKWRFPCTKSLYPFHDGKYEDFEPVFRNLIINDINDGESAAYTTAFFPVAEQLDRQGDEATKLGHADTASELYLRAATVLRIARFPYITAFPHVSDDAKWKAWTWQKEVYMKAGRSWEIPVTEVMIPHVHARGLDRGEIPAYVRVPLSEGETAVAAPASSSAVAAAASVAVTSPDTAAQQGRKKVPAVLLLTGLDGYRPDNTVRTDEFVSRGWAAVVAEIPGTADCPADPADPLSPDRLWTSVLDWMAADGRFDMSRVLVWGLSAGGYYAIRIAHTHRERLRGVVAQGAGCHHFYDAEWMERAEGHEYPFKLAPAMAMKHGFGTDLDAYKREGMRKFSLLEGEGEGVAVLKNTEGSTRLLLINGIQDGLMPIEDSMLLFEHGSPKEARFFDNALHMGYPMANSSVYPWMEQVMGGN